MNAARLIARKRDGDVLSSEEISTLITAYSAGEVPDYQMSAWAMAVCCRGMNRDETVALTKAMLDSGSTLRSADIASRVDKHSTGGIGDKTSFIIAPLLACCGLRVPMISGRGLGPTGGTLDKYESIPGIRTDLSRDEIESIVASVGCVITSATADLVPADRKLYALRDVTGTVTSIPLITASILSKKLAESISALVMDVKFGSGAFMKTRHQARALAESLVAVGYQLGLPTSALLTAMSAPTGRMIGNAVEIDEVLETLSGSGPADLRELVLALTSEIVLTKSLAGDQASARSLLADHLDSGRALNKFAEMVAAQGGDLEAPRERAPAWTYLAAEEGYLAAIDAERLGFAIIQMGGGRSRKEDSIDHRVGMEMLVGLGDRVHIGQPLLNIFAPAAARTRCLQAIESCLTIAPEPPLKAPLIAERIGCDPTDPDHSPRIEPFVSATRTLGEPSAEQLQPTLSDFRFRQALTDEALRMRDHAHAPYSGFRVGAALMAASGQIYGGANVENASYGLTICAERSAFVAAVAAGETSFRALAVASPGGAAPCGACRQFAAEFCRDLPVLLINTEFPSTIVEWRLSDLLPARFHFPPSHSE